MVGEGGIGVGIKRRDRETEEKMGLGVERRRVGRERGGMGGDGGVRCHGAAPAPRPLTEAAGVQGRRHVIESLSLT